MFFLFLGSADQKGTIMGIFRSLGALARALGPIFASMCEFYFKITVNCLRNGEKKVHLKSC